MIAPGVHPKTFLKSICFKNFVITAYIIFRRASFVEPPTKQCRQRQKIFNKHREKQKKQQDVVVKIRTHGGV
jgi:hypothetical protein